MEPLYFSYLALLAALLPAYLLRFTLFGIPTNLFELLVAVAVIAGSFQSSVRHSWWRAARSFPKPAALFLIFFLLAAGISTLISPHLRTSLGILKGWIIIPLVYAFVVYAAAGLEAGRLKLEFRKALVFSGLAMALIGLSQVGQLERIKGIYDVPNSLALYLTPLIILALFQIPASRFQILAATVMFAAMLFTQSLGGVLAVVVALAIGWFFFALITHYALLITGRC